MDDTGDSLKACLTRLGQAETADYVAQRRDLVDTFIASIDSPASREKLLDLQRSVEQLRAISGGTSQSLPELLAMIHASLQEIVVHTERLKRGYEQLFDSRS